MYVQFLVFSLVSGKYLFTGRFVSKVLHVWFGFFSTAYVNVRGEREIEGIAKQKELELKRLGKISVK